MKIESQQKRIFMILETICYMFSIATPASSCPAQLKAKIIITYNYEWPKAPSTMVQFLIGVSWRRRRRGRHFEVLLQSIDQSICFHVCCHCTCCGCTASGPIKLRSRPERPDMQPIRCEETGKRKATQCLISNRHFGNCLKCSHRDYDNICITASRLWSHEMLRTKQRNQISKGSAQHITL